MSEKKPAALFPQRKPKRCPVCQQPTYSSGGIHPQCAEKQADEPRRLKLVAEEEAKEASKETDLRLHKGQL